VLIPQSIEGGGVGSFDFWQRWLFGLSVAIAVFGFALAALNQTPVFDFLFNRQVDPVFWGKGTVPTEAKLFQRWVYGVLGAVLCGWGVFMAYVVRYPFRSKEKWAWDCIAVGIGLWFIMDTALSFYFGVWFNAMFNVILAVLISLPLLCTRRDFRRERHA
jgi:hypothetical protein